MGKTTTFPKMWGGVLVALLLLLVPLVLIACGGQPTEVAMEPTTAPTEAPPTEAVPTDSPPTEVPTEPPPTEMPTEAPTEPPPTDTPEPTEEPAPEAVDDTACIACHTDEETLRALAVEPDASESLSEGEG